jgi:hypothetical protein
VVKDPESTHRKAHGRDHQRTHDHVAVEVLAGARAVPPIFQ